MVNFVKDLKSDLTSLDKTTLELGSNLRDLTKGSSKAIRGIADLSTNLKSADSAALKFTKSFAAVGSIAGGTIATFLGFAGVASTLSTLASIGDKAYKSFKDLSGVSRTLRFEEAILGTNQLAQNFEYLEQTSNTALDSIKLGLRSVFDAGGFEQFSGKAVAAFAPVEQAAYRLSTVTVASGERSINALDKNIASMRKLQKATNDALGSVELLNAQYDIASAGFTTPQANADVGKSSVDLSQAGFGDLAGSTNAVVRTLRALGDESDQASLRASQLFETTRVGLITLDQLTPVIGSLAVQSKQLGVDFAEVTASVAGLTTQGASAGEAATRLEALFNEITTASPKANEALAAFRDEMGKPIQLNASALKEKGIKGIINDIKKATGGDVAKIQGLFSTKEATEAVQLLISLGDKAFGEYTDRIKNVDTSDLGKEAEGRTKTISGAFAQAQNSSQRQVEEFGSGFSDSVVNEVLNANQSFKGLATGSAEAIGKLTGTFSGLVEKVKSIGGFLATTFSSIAPLVLFTVIGKKIKELGDSLKKEAKSGETIWDVVKRKGFDAFADIYTRWVSTIEKIKVKAKEAGAEINKGINQGKADTASKIPQKPAGEQASLFDTSQFESKTEPVNTKQKPKEEIKSVKDTKSKFDDVPTDKNVIDTSNVKSARNRKPIKTTSNVKQLELDFSAPKLKGIEGFKSSVTSFQQSTAKTFTSIGKVGSGTFSAVGKAANFAAPLVKQVAGTMLGLGAGAAIGFVAVSALSGWVDTLGKFLDKRANPALAEMAETLKDIKGVEGLGDILKGFDKTAPNVESTSFTMNVLNESLERGKGLWNDVIGASTLLASQTLPEIDKVNEALDTQIAKNSELARAGKIGTTTTEGKSAEDKITRGITLTADDETALKNETKEKQRVLTARVAQEELRLQEIEKNGGRNKVEELEAQRQKLETVKGIAEAEKKNLDTALQRKLVEQQIEKFKAVDTTIPLQIQLQENTTSAVQAQIDEISQTLNAKDVDIFGDPKKYSEQFADITKKIGGTLDTIDIELEFNTDNASALRDKLIEEVGAENFDKLIASNPAFRKRVTDQNKSFSAAKVQSAQTVEKTETTALETAQSLGSEATTVTKAKVEKQTSSLTAQTAALNEELQRPETTLNRQKEIMSQIEEIESKRASLNIEAAISSELGARKQQLTLEQEILSIKQATLGLFNQESKFGSLAITGAQAKVQAAQQELEIKKEQLSIEGREGVIKKQEIVDSLKRREERQDSQANAGLKGFDLKDPNLAKSLQEKRDSFTAQSADEVKKKQENIKVNEQAKLKEAQNKAKVFSAEEQQKIAGALSQKTIGGNGFTDSITGNDIVKGKLKEEFQKSTFNADGTLKANEDKLRESISKASLDKEFDTAAKGREADAIFNKKDDELKKSTTDIKSSSAQDSAAVDKNAKQSIDEKGKLLDAVAAKAKVAGERKNDLGSVIGEDKTPKNKDVARVQPRDDAKATDKAKDGEITAQSDLAFSKAMASVKDKLGSMAQRIALNEAKIELEYAGREKLIKRGELLGDALQSLAGQSDLFGDTVAGAQLALQSLQTKNAPEKAQEEGDKEISKINQKVKDLAQNAVDARSALDTAKAAGADDKTIANLSAQATDAEKLSAGANKEKAGDIVFVKQATAAAKLNAQLEINIASINAEFASRDKLIKKGEQLSESLSGLIGKSDLFGDSAVGASLQLEALKLQKRPEKIDSTAEKDSRKVDERVKALQENAKNTEASLKEAIATGADAKTVNTLKTQSQTANQTAVDGLKEASGDKEQIKQKAAIDKLAASIDLTVASINSEYAAREKSAKQAIELADNLSQLSGATLLQNSAAALSLKESSNKLSGANVDLEANKKIELINARISTLSSLASQSGPVGDKARAELPKAQQEAGAEVESINSSRAFAKINSEFESSANAIEKESFGRQRLTEINETLASSFSTLAGTASKLFANSSVGSKIGAIGSQLQATTGQDKAKLDFQKQAKLLDARSATLSKGITIAQQNGAGSSTLNALRKAKSEDDVQRGVEKSYLKQKLVIEGVNAKLGVLASKAEEFGESLGKQAQLFKDKLDLEDRKRADAVENNKSGTGLQSSLLDFLGKNNPVSKQLQQRTDIQSGRDEAVAKQAQNVNDAKKEIIDNTVLKSQLDLELKNYENAITQTALLSDLLSVSQGGGASASNSADIKQQLGNLPQLLKEGRDQANQRKGLLDEKIAFLPQELETKQASVKRNLLSSELSNFSGNLNPANIDLLTRTLGETEKEVKGFRRQDVKVGSLQDADFQAQLKALGSKTSIPKPSRPDLVVDNSLRNTLPVGRKGGGGGVSIQSPINITISTNGKGDNSQLQQELKRSIGTQVESGMNKLSTKVLSYAKGF
jgi:hypothetical protein